MKPDQSTPEQRIIDDIVSSADRNDFFASVENDFVERLQHDQSAPPHKGRGWYGAIAVVLVLSAIVVTWLMMTDDDVNVVPVTTTVERSDEVTHQPTIAEPVPTTAVLETTATQRPALTMPPSNGTTPHSPNAMTATASSSESMALRARREVDSLRMELARTADRTHSLSLRYDIGVRLRIAGAAVESMDVLSQLAIESEQVGATLLAARSNQQAAVAARDLGQSARAMDLLKKAIALHPDKSSAQCKRWETQLTEWQR